MSQKVNNSVKRAEVLGPFEDFDPDKADKLLRSAEDICDSEWQAALHLAVCLMGLAPDLEYAQLLIRCIDTVAKNAEN
jgi:ABC-type cobalamin transport system ATPase subunit